VLNAVKVVHEFGAEIEKLYREVVEQFSGVGDLDPFYRMIDQSAAVQRVSHRFLKLANHLADPLRAYVEPFRCIGSFLRADGVMENGNVPKDGFAEIMKFLRAHRHDLSSLNYRAR
jgi:hypothetical protein